MNNYRAVFLHRSSRWPHNTSQSSGHMGLKTDQIQYGNNVLALFPPCLWLVPPGPDTLTRTDRAPCLRCLQSTPGYGNWQSAANWNREEKSGHCFAFFPRYLFFSFIGDAVVIEIPVAKENNKCLINDFLSMLLKTDDVRASFCSILITVDLVYWLYCDLG